MKIKELLIKENWTANQYNRSWNTETNLWQYEHRAKLGLGPNDRDKVVHHKDGNIHNNRKSNLEILDRGSHARTGRPALKHEKCTKCGKKHFAKGFCRQCYYKKFHR